MESEEGVYYNQRPRTGAAHQAPSLWSSSSPCLLRRDAMTLLVSTHFLPVRGLFECHTRLRRSPHFPVEVVPVQSSILRVSTIGRPGQLFHHKDCMSRFHHCKIQEKYRILPTLSIALSSKSIAGFIRSLSVWYQRSGIVVLLVQHAWLQTKVIQKVDHLISKPELRTFWWSELNQRW